MHMRILPLAYLITPLLSAAPVHETMSFGGVTRDYLYVLPAAYDAKASIPLVFIFHGAGGTGPSTESSLGFTQLQGRKYFLAVYPDGVDKWWNGGRTLPQSLASARSDDVGFISALIDRLAGNFNIDLRRVFATGSSNGAIFCETLAVRLSDRIAAIGPVNGTLGPAVAAKYPPRHPVSVISFNGTADTFVPFTGENIPDHVLLSAPDTIAFWVKLDGCDPAAVVTEIPKAVPDDGTAVKRFDFRRGRDNTEVVAYVIAHGGHTWPGDHTDPSWAKRAGKTAMSINATELVWDFFEAHPKS